MLTITAAVMNTAVARHLAQPENRIRYALGNWRLWSEHQDTYQVKLARAAFYKWVDIAQCDDEGHF